MGVSTRMQYLENLDDVGIDPGLVAFGPCSAAKSDDLGKSRVAAHVEGRVADGAREALWYMEIIQRQDTAFVGTHPENVRRIMFLRHRENAEAIGKKQFFRIDSCHGPVSVGEERPRAQGLPRAASKANQAVLRICASRLKGPPPAAAR